MPIYLKNSTKINLHITYFVKTQYFVIVNLVRTNKKSNTLCANLRNVKKRSGYVLRRDFHLYPIRCQKSSLAYVTLLRLKLEKHRSQSYFCGESINILISVCKFLYLYSKTPISPV